jgi:hypothetical protein
MSTRKLTNILTNSEREQLGRNWHTAKAAEDLKSIPAGCYRCRVIDGGLFNARSGTLGYKLTLEIIEGKHQGRRLWHDVWLTKAAMSIAKRDLGKIGITNDEQLLQPLPEGIIVDAKVALRKDEDGTEYNRVSRLELVALEPPEPEPFAPKGDSNGTVDQQGFDWRDGQQKDPPASGRGRGAYSQA